MRPRHKSHFVAGGSHIDPALQQHPVEFFEFIPAVFGYFRARRYGGSFAERRPKDGSDAEDLESVTFFSCIFVDGVDESFGLFFEGFIESRP